MFCHLVTLIPSTPLGHVSGGGLEQIDHIWTCLTQYHRHKASRQSFIITAILIAESDTECEAPTSPPNRGYVDDGSLTGEDRRVSSQNGLHSRLSYYAAFKV